AELGRKLIQRLSARRPEADADKGRVALAGDVGERRVAVAAHLDDVASALAVEQSVVEHELARRRRIGVAEDDVFDVLNAHGSLPCRGSPPVGRSPSASFTPAGPGHRPSDRSGSDHGPPRARRYVAQSDDYVNSDFIIILVAGNGREGTGNLSH